MISLSDDNYRLCESISQDLEHIGRTWTDTISEQLIRRESPIIRRLLVHNDYSKAWRLLGLPGEPYVMGHDLDEVIGDVPIKYVQIAFPTPNERVKIRHNGNVKIVFTPPPSKGDLMITGEAYTAYNGVFYMVIPKNEVQGDISPQDNVAALTIKHSYPSPVKLSEYLKSSGAIINSKKIKRSEIIDFIVNAMGGAHYDPQSRNNKKVARALLKPMHVSWSGDQTTIHAPWIEFLSIGLSIAYSADARRFREEFQKVKNANEKQSP